MASVSKRRWTHEGVAKTAWVLRYIDQGGMRRQETFEQKKHADKRRLQVETELDRRIHVAVSDSCTISELGAAFLKECDRRRAIADRMTLTSLTSYRNVVERHICKRFGAAKVVDVRAAELQMWLNELAVTFKRSTVSKVREVFSLMLSFAVATERVGRNIIKEGRVRVPTMKKSRTAIPSRADIRALLEATDRREPGERTSCYINRRVVITIGLFCGLRRGEMAGLDWNHIRFDKGVIEIRQAYSSYDRLKAPKTENGVRDVPISVPVLDALLALHEAAGRPTAGPVLVTQRGNRYYPQEVWRLWTQVAIKAGLGTVAQPGGRGAKRTATMKFKLHALRHAAASLLIAEGLTPSHVKTFMGHARIATTMDIYGHLFPEDGVIRAGVTNAAARFLGARVTQERLTY